MRNSIIPPSFLNASRVLRRQVTHRQIAGGAMRVFRNGQIVFQDFAGYADLENQLPIQHDTIYAIYSMSKVITTVALLQLYEQGLFKMKDPVSDFLPGYKDQRVGVEVEPGKFDIVPAKSPMLMKHLFTMTSGLAYGGDHPFGKWLEENADTLKGLGTKDAFNKIGEAPLLFHPGEDYLYGYSIDVLGAVLESITGFRLGDYLSREIFQPLGMVDTGFYLTEEQMGRASFEYQDAERVLPDGRKFQTLQAIPREKARASTTRPLSEGGGGGLLSTLPDYAAFCHMLLNGGTLNGQRILGRKTIDFMATDHLTPKQRASFNAWSRHNDGCGYGLGVRVRTDSGLVSNGSVGEFGWDGAAGTWMAIDPKENLYAVYMVQRMPGNHSTIIPPITAAMYAGLD